MPKMSLDEKRWQAQQDLEALRRAEEIRSNAQRKAAVKKLVAQEQKALARVSKNTGSKSRRGR